MGAIDLVVALLLHYCLLVRPFLATGLELSVFRAQCALPVKISGCAILSFLSFLDNVL